ncbi:shieldin complex subunit 2 isoform X2 [Tamandua tetradactyla]|uniref:shieldin complex subunit 2 isoform X2 n=1 Tax=Tamandua tetradactyla TaxID=48850 RepID=UPI004053BB2D
MSAESQVHVFWGAPVGPLKMTASQEPTSLISTAEPWKKIQFLCNQRPLQLKDEKCKDKTRDDCSVLEAVDSPLQCSAFLSSSIHMNDDCLHCISEIQTIKSQKTCPSRMSDATDSGVQVCGFKGRTQLNLAEGEKYQKLPVENRTITVEQHNDRSSICGQKLKKNSLQVDRKCTAILDLVCSTKQTTTEPETVETKCVYHDIQNQCPQFFSSKTADKPRSKGAVRTVSDFKISTNTEFLSIMTSSQIAFLAQRQDKGQDCINKGAMSMEIEPKANQRKESTSGDNFILSNGDPAEDSESGENQEHSLELFSPVSHETKSSCIDVNFDKSLEGNTGSQEPSRSKDKLPPTEICIESYGSGLLCSQLRTFSTGSTEGRGTSEDKPGHSKAPLKVLLGAKEAKWISDARDPAIMPGQSNMSKLKRFKKTSLIKNCDCKSRKYNCLVMVLSPCYVKEISIKSGPNSGSKVPLATAVVADQSDTRRVFLWRTAALWALTVFLGDVILLTDVTIHEDQWARETVLQSTFTSQLLNLGRYSSVQPEEYSSVVSTAVLQDLLAHMSSAHPHLKGLPQRQPQKASRTEFVELEQLQPDVLVHVTLRVVGITVLTEALYNYRGQRQRKVVLTVEQTQGQHHVLVLWGPGAAWYPQLQRKKDYIWEFKYLLVQRNCMSENLELHTTPWSSCECLFDDDKRAVQFKAKFQKSATSLVKMSDLATHLEEKRSGVVLIKPQILELNFPVTTAQKSQITLSAHSSLQSIFSSLPNIIYTGCAKCGVELETDENKIYKQCFSCLPFTMKKTYYRTCSFPGALWHFKQDSFSPQRLSQLCRVCGVPETRSLELLDMESASSNDRS